MSKINKTEAMTIAKQFARRVRSELDKDAEVYLFGSAARDETREGSDIDIAVVSKIFGNDFSGDFVKINRIACDIDLGIEAYPINYKEWGKRITPFIKQIRKDGIAAWK